MTWKEANDLMEKYNELSNEVDKICKVIGDMPVAHFPFLHEKLIELFEESYEIATEMYAYYIQESLIWSASLILETEHYLEEGLYLLKTAA